MSKLNAIQERTTAKGELPATENFALQVSAYGTDTKNRDSIKGIRLDTGEEVEVILRAYKSEQPLKAARAEVKDFKATAGEVSTLMNALPNDEMRKQVLKGMKAKTEPGGVILVQRAYQERDTGVINAGWLQSAAKYEGHCTVVPNVMLRIDPVQYGQRNNQPVASSNATALYTEQSELVKSKEELAAAITNALATSVIDGARPMVMIRASDNEGSAKAIEYMLPVRLDKETNEYVKSTPAEGLEAFRALGVGKQIEDLVGDPDLKIEVIPGSRMSIGSQAKAGYESSAAGLSAVNAPYRFDKSAQDSTGFTSSLIVLHKVGDGVVFTAATPLSNRPALFHGRDVETPFRSGPPAATHETKEVAAPAAEVTSETGSAQQDSEFDIEDVVQQQQAEQAAPAAPRMRA